MGKALVPIGVILLVILMIGGCGVGQYNGLVTARTGVQTQFAQVDNQLQRRNDLIPNLVKTVQGFAAQEQTVFGAIAAARAQMAGAKSPADKIAAGQSMDSALGRLLVVVENYPQLKSQENFLALQDELANTENKLAVERGRYNALVGAFNARVQRFPTNIFAGIMHFGLEPFYKVADSAKEVPKVDFGTK